MLEEVEDRAQAGQGEKVAGGTAEAMVPMAVARKECGHLMHTASG